MASGGGGPVGVEGQVGEILTSPDQYTIDAAGVVKLVDPLALNEEIGIFYTGDTIIEAGRNFKILAENHLDNGFIASAAVIGDALILRSTMDLYRIESMK